MRIVVEPAGIGERGVERVLASMAERRMAEVVGEAQSLRQVLVEPERASDGAADLRDFEAVRQAHAKMVAIGRDEHLGLVPQPAEGDRVDDAVAVALEDVARAARAAIGFSDAGGRAIATDARRAPREASFRAEWHNPVSLGIGPLEGVDADDLQILGEDLGIGLAAERPDDQPHAVRALARRSRVMPSNSSRFLDSDPLEIAVGSASAFGAARQLQPDLLRRELRRRAAAAAAARHWRRISDLRRPRWLSNSAEPLPARRCQLGCTPGPAGGAVRRSRQDDRCSRLRLPSAMTPACRAGRCCTRRRYRSKSGKMPRLTAAAFWPA